MAYTNVWDESAPSDTSLASLLGQDIRTFKTDIRERVCQMSGTLANRPTPDNLWGRLLYFSLDTGQIFQWSDTAWVDVTGFLLSKVVDAQAGVTILGSGSPGQTLVVSPMPLIGPGQGFRAKYVIGMSGAHPTNTSLSYLYNGTVLNVAGSVIVNASSPQIASSFTLVNLPGSQTEQVFMHDVITSFDAIELNAYAEKQFANTGITGSLAVITETGLPSGEQLTTDGWIVELI